MGGGAVVVLDVGGTATSASLVVPDPGSAWGIRSAHSHRLEGLGGEVLAEALVGLLVRDFYGAGTRTADVGDRMALQRLDDAAREALLELGGEAGQRGRAQVNVPYLGVDGQMRPRHLDVGVGRTVLEAEVQELVRERAGDYRAQGVLAEATWPGCCPRWSCACWRTGRPAPSRWRRSLWWGEGRAAPSFRGRRGMPWRFSGVRCWRRRSWSCRRAS